MMRHVVTTLVVCAAATLPARAQDPAAQTKQVFERHAVLDGKIQGARVAVESRLTKNAPYTAEAVTESTQALADGNRIVTRNATRIFRDSEGRTRREQLNAAGSDVLNINISDPVAGTSYMLDPASRQAYRGGQIFFAATRAGENVAFSTAAGVPPGAMAAGGGGTITMTRSLDGGVAVVGQEMDGKAAAEAIAAKAAGLADEMKARIAAPGVGAGGATFVAAGVFPRIAEGVGKTTREEIGQQTIEGVMAVGTRSVTEIPAGAIGNEQPIKILSEQWFSPELQVLVMTRHSDPRVGETVYRLTGIIRAEPAHALFDLPPDYTLNESAIRREEQR